MLSMYSDLFNENTKYSEFPEPFLMDCINYSVLNFKKNIKKSKEDVIIHRIIHDDKKIVKIFLGNKVDYSKQHELIYDSEPTNLIVISGCNKFYDHLINDINYEFSKLYKYKKIKDSIWDVTGLTAFDEKIIINKLKNYIMIDNELNKPSIDNIDFGIDTTEHIKVTDDEIELINVFNYVDSDSNVKYVLNNETIYSLIINMSCKPRNTEYDSDLIIEKHMYGFQINKNILNVSDILRICKEIGIDLNGSCINKICHNIIDEELSYLPKNSDVPVTDVCLFPNIGSNPDSNYTKPKQTVPILVYNHINNYVSTTTNNHLPEFETINNDKFKNIDDNILYAINQVSDKIKYINEQIETMTELKKELIKMNN